jgi:hypothetical protein
MELQRDAAGVGAINGLAQRCGVRAVSGLGARVLGRGRMEAEPTETRLDAAAPEPPFSLAEKPARLFGHRHPRVVNTDPAGRSEPFVTSCERPPFAGVALMTAAEETRRSTLFLFDRSRAAEVTGPLSPRHRAMRGALQHGLRYNGSSPTRAVRHQRTASRSRSSSRELV